MTALAVIAMLAMFAGLLAVPQVRARAVELATKLLDSKGFAEAEHANSSLRNLGVILLAVIVAIVVPVVVMQLLAELLPTYFTSLGELFTALDAINTTGWPPIVALVFPYIALVLGVTAISAVFALGTLLVIKIVRK